MSESTEVATLSSKEIANIEQEIMNKAAELKSKLAVTGNKISMKDKKFKLPDGTELSAPLDVIVMGWNSRNVWYEGAYDPKNIQSPSCFAIGDKPDALEPDESVENPQAASCETCDKNQWGSGSGDGKACKNMRQLAVRLPSREGIYTMSLAPTSIKDFDAAMGSMITAFGDPIRAIVQVGFHPDKSYAQTVFSNPQPNPTWAQDYQRRQTGEVDKILAIKPE